MVHVLFIDVIQETPHADKMLRQQKSVANQEGLSGLTAWFLKENTKLGGYKSISSNVHVVLVLAKSRARSVPQSPRCIIRWNVAVWMNRGADKCRPAPLRYSGIKLPAGHGPYILNNTLYLLSPGPPTPFPVPVTTLPSLIIFQVSDWDLGSDSPLNVRRWPRWAARLCS